jgi:raffinose/stachyose/melibiose transport system substrate-binding protein
MRLLDNLVETLCGAAKHDALTSMTASWKDEACATKAFNEFARWNKAGYMGKDYMGIDNNAAEVNVYTGKTAMMLEGDWQVNGISDQGEDLANYGVFPFPTGTDRLYFFAEMLYVSAKSPHHDAAVRFLDYLTSTKVQQDQLGNFGSVSVNGQVKYPDNRRPLDKQWSDIFAAYKNVFQPGDQAFPLAVTTEYWRIQNGVITGSIDPNAAAGQLQAFIDNYKKNPQASAATKAP